MYLQPSIIIITYIDLPAVYICPEANGCFATRRRSARLGREIKTEIGWIIYENIIYNKIIIMIIYEYSGPRGSASYKNPCACIYIRAL